MKMIFAIVHKEDEGFVVERLNKERISVTKLSSTGGFLRKGNTTLMIGTEDDKVETCSRSSKKSVPEEKKCLSEPTYSDGTKDRCWDIPHRRSPLMWAVQPYLL